MELKDLVVISELSKDCDDMVVRLVDSDYGDTTCIATTVDEVVDLVRGHLSGLGFFITLGERRLDDKGEG